MPETLLKQMNSKDWVVREAAFRDICMLPPEAFAEIVELEAQQYRDWMPTAWLKTLGTTAGCIICFQIFASAIGRPHMVTIIFGPLGAFIPFFFGYFRIFKIPPAHHAIAQIIAEKEDVRFVPFALVTLESVGYMQTHNIMKAVVKKLLPQVTYAQAQSWTDKQRKALLKRLGPETSAVNPEMTLCILKALEQIGGDWAVKGVEALETMRYYSGMKRPYSVSKAEAIQRNREIRDATQHCLPFLKLRADETRLARTLLRAAGLNTAAPDTLLRAATPTSDRTAQTALLRPQQRG